MDKLFRALQDSTEKPPKCKCGVQKLWDTKLKKWYCPICKFDK